MLKLQQERKLQKQNKKEAKESKARGEMERLQKIGSLNSFANTDFALDTIFQHVQNTQLANQSK